MSNETTTETPTEMRLRFIDDALSEQGGKLTALDVLKDIREELRKRQEQDGRLNNALVEIKRRVSAITFFAGGLFMFALVALLGRAFHYP
jgi:hypothetical protein